MVLDISGGQHAGGDAAKLPDGKARRIRNLVLEDEWVSRPPFTYDNLTNVRGLGIWHDDTNNARRLMALTNTAGATAAYAKAAATETWSADVSSADALFGTITDSVNFRGKFLACSPASGSATTPLRMHYYDGTTWARTAGIPSPMRPRSVAVHNGRLMIGGALLVGTNLVNSPAVDAYPTTNWTLTNVTSGSIAGTGGSTLVRITPTNTTTASVQITVPTSIGNFFGSQGVNTVQFRSDLRGVDMSYDVPVTVQVRYSSPRYDLNAYTVGQVVVPATPNNLRYRCTVAGTTAAAPPVYPTTVGTTVADGTVTWICDGSDVAAQQENYIPSLSKTSRWTTTVAIATIPAGANTDLAFRIKFGTVSVPTYTLAPLDFSYKDGLAESNPLKENHGQQFSSDRFVAPFFSNETTTGFSIDRSDYIYWSEVLDPLNIGSANYYPITEAPGPITAIRSTGEYLVVFKRNARWVFASSDSADIVILPVGSIQKGAGCLNPKALDTADIDGAMYYLGENGFYRWRVGSDPEELCGEAMLRRVFNKSTASWVESQSSPANRALLTIDQKNHRVLIYTQKGIIFCYDIRRQAWSEIDAGGDTSVSPVGYQVCDMIYNPQTGNVYVAFSEAATGTAGLARLDDTQAAAEDQISSTGTLTVHHDVWFKPAEAQPRVDIRVDDLIVQTGCTVAGQEATCYVSENQGATFTATTIPRDLLTTTSNYAPEHFVIFKGWGSIMARLLVSGKAGTGALKLSYAALKLFTRKAPEYKKR